MNILAKSSLAACFLLEACNEVGPTISKVFDDTATINPAVASCSDKAGKAEIIDKKTGDTVWRSIQNILPHGVSQVEAVKSAKDEKGAIVYQYHYREKLTVDQDKDVCILGNPSSAGSLRYVLVKTDSPNPS